MSELSEIEIELNAEWQQTMTIIPRAALQTARELYAKNSSATKKSSNKNFTSLEYKKKREEFLMLYYCGSILRKIHQQDDSVAQHLVSPHRSDQSVHANSSISPASRPRSGSDSDISPTVVHTETLDAQRKFTFNHATNPADIIPQANSLPVKPTLTHSVSQSLDDGEDEWTNNSNKEEEKTEDFIKWEKKSALRAQRRKSILPLLKFDNVDGIINRINYSNPIPITPHRQKPMYILLLFFTIIKMPN